MNSPAVPVSEAPATQPQPRDYAVVIIGISVSLALLVLVGFALYSIQKGQSDQLGTVEGIGKGTGILGILSLFVYLAAKIVTRNDTKKAKSKPLVPAFGLLMTVVTGFVSARTASTLKEQMAQAKQLNEQVAALQQSRGELLDFLHTVSQKENLHFVNANVNEQDWRASVLAIEKLKPGQRKKTVYGAILLAWQNIPLSLKNPGMAKGGVDSANFWRHVFESAGIVVSPTGSERVSDAVKRQFMKVDAPEPGDLLFYEGAEKTSVGNFVMMYLGPGQEGGRGICLGVYDTGRTVEIIDSYYFDRVSPPDHFLGYYRPTYSD